MTALGALVDGDWDVVVVGAGLGGGVVGRRLAEGGAQVLFLERGPARPERPPERWLEEITDPEERLSRGYWPEQLTATVDGHVARYFAPIGAAAGGSSLFYAAMLERPEPHEIDATADLAHPTGGWPVSYAALAPYYAEAEVMFAVCGDPDPLGAGGSPTGLRPPPPVSEADAAMMQLLRRRRLHPYRKHVGVRYLPGCEQCFGRMCPRGCKMEGRSAGIEPAMATGRAEILDRCEVIALRGGRQRVTLVEARRGSETLRFRARAVVLAAGGLSSPRLLLASASPHWPDGCANGSGLVGRNLMFHLNERFAYWPNTRIDAAPPFGLVSLRDFYRSGDQRLGHVHAMGLQVDYGSILQFLKHRFDASRLGRVRPLRPFLRLPAAAATLLLGRAHMFVGLLEDLPQPGNRVTFDPANPARMAFEYRLTPELQARRQAFRALIRRRFGRPRTHFLNLEPELNLAHCCGTLRFGNAPEASVLDASCRAHEIDNLYVADGSFMPTSNGVNPSLTIAANALRVADAMLAARLGGDAETEGAGRAG